MTTPNDISYLMRRVALPCAAAIASVALSSCSASPRSPESRPAITTTTTSPGKSEAVQGHIPSASSADAFTQEQGIADNMTCHIRNSFTVIPRLPNGQIDTGHTGLALQLSFSDSDNHQTLVAPDRGINISAPLLNYFVELKPNTVVYEGNYQLPSFTEDLGTLITVPESDSIPGTILGIEEDQRVSDVLPGQQHAETLSVPCGAYEYTTHGWIIDSAIHMPGSVGSGSIAATPVEQPGQPNS